MGLVTWWYVDLNYYQFSTPIHLYLHIMFEDNSKDKIIIFVIFHFFFLIAFTFFYFFILFSFVRSHFLTKNLEFAITVLCRVAKKTYFT